jgi:hypothetical protein
MKKIISSSAVLILLLANLSAQNCTMYFPSKVGTVLKYVYSEKVDKPVSSCTYKLVSQETQGKFLINNIAGESFDKKDKSKMTFTFTSKCDGNSFYIDMKSFLSGMDVKNFSDFKIESSELQIPLGLTAGQKLNDGWINMSMQTESPVSMGFKTTITNRVVDGFEEITTPAGTFKCAKILYDSQTEAMFMKTTNRVVEWYSVNIGLVRSETYDKKGKLMGFNVLSSIQ